jgi:hypothetical protein
MTCLVCLAVSDWFQCLYFIFVSLLLSLPFVFIAYSRPYNLRPTYCPT